MAEFNAGRQERDTERRTSVAAASGAGRARRIVMVLIAAAVLTGFTLLVVYSYDRGSAPTTGKNAPLITADKGPTKIRPKEPGGMLVPDRDKQVFSRINPTENPPRIEHLLPPPDTIVARSAPAGKKPDSSRRVASRAAAGAGSGQTEVLVAPAKPAAVKKSAARPAPKPKVKPAPKPKSAAKPAAKPKVIAKPAPAPLPKARSKPAAKPGPAAAKTVTPVAPPSKKPAKTPARLSLLPDPTATTKDMRGWRVQIAAFRSVEATKRSWQRVRRRHKDVLGSLELSVVKADLGKKGVYYRMQAGPLAGADAARKLCAEIKKRKLGCLVVRP